MDSKDFTPGTGAQDLARPGRESWQRFVALHGLGASTRDLAAVLDVSEKEVDAARTPAVAPGGRRPRRDFSELFERWHGRPPEDEDWPPPRYKAGHGSYEWLLSEHLLLASLVGELGVQEIAELLTTRLRSITKDPVAQRTAASVQGQIVRLGLQATDVLGGLPLAAAARQVGSYQVVYSAVSRGQLPHRKVGRLIVIPYAEWERWKASIQGPPEGYVQLSTLRQALSVKSDKLSEFARMGYVPGAVLIQPVGVAGIKTTSRGTWYVPPALAEQLLVDRRAGRPMPWHGKPILDNLKATYRLWTERRHPANCTTCRQIWGIDGAPDCFDEYARRYPSLAFGAKRHLTMAWSPGITVPELAREAGRTEQAVRDAIDNGVLDATKRGRIRYVTRTDATRWIARNCPTGTSQKSWISLAMAERLYQFSPKDIQSFIERDLIPSKLGMAGSQRGVLYVARHQCGQLREKLGFTEAQAAARVGVSLEELRRLLVGVNWRGSEQIPLGTVRAVIKRVRSACGLSIKDAALGLGTTVQWVEDRVADGTVKLTRNDWSERLYVSGPMLERLKAALAAPPGRPGAKWIGLSEAAHLAGVCSATLIRWCESGAMRRRSFGSQWRYHADDVRERARQYWPTARLKRAKPPEWLSTELASANRAG